MNRIFKLIMLLVLVCSSTKLLNAQTDTASVCQYIKTGSGYLMVLRESDDVIAAIERLATIEKVPSGNFTGIGFAREVTFGFFDADKKIFKPKTIRKVEMGSLTGSIAWSEEKPSVHIHGVATDDKFKAYGGHILALRVGSGSMEIYIMLNQQKLERKLEQPLGANVLQLSCGEN